MATKVQREAKAARHSLDAEYRDTLMRALTEGVQALVAEKAPGLREDPQKVAARMIAAVPRAHAYDELVGPFYNVDAVRTMLGGVSRQAVQERARADRRTLLQVQTSDGVNLYPAFQFEGSEVPARMRKTISTFRNVPVDGWAIATWFSVPAQALGGLAPRAWLADAHRDTTPVLELAERTAQRWSAP